MAAEPDSHANHHGLSVRHVDEHSAYMDKNFRDAVLKASG